MDITVHKLRSSTLAKKSKKTTDENVVNAWIANVETAKAFPASDLEALQKRFDGQLTVARLKDGGLAIYSSHDRGRWDEFTSFMRDHTPFQAQALDLRRST